MSAIITEDVDLMNAYVAEVVAANRNLTDDLLLTKAKLSLAELRNERLMQKLAAYDAVKATDKPAPDPAAEQALDAEPPKTETS